MNDDPNACLNCGRFSPNKDFCSHDCYLDYEEPDELYEDEIEGA